MNENEKIIFDELMKLLIIQRAFNSPDISDEDLCKLADHCTPYLTSLVKKVEDLKLQRDSEELEKNLEKINKRKNYSTKKIEYNSSNDASNDALLSDFEFDDGDEISKSKKQRVLN
jgi:hypothetical protein